MGDFETYNRADYEEIEHMEIELGARARGLLPASLTLSENVWDSLYSTNIPRRCLSRFESAELWKRSFDYEMDLLPELNEQYISEGEPIPKGRLTGQFWPVKIKAHFASFADSLCAVDLD